MDCQITRLKSHPYTLVTLSSFPPLKTGLPMSASAEDEVAISYPSDSIYETYFDSSVNIQGSN